jgi:hypothetical protein
MRALFLVLLASSGPFFVHPLLASAQDEHEEVTAVDPIARESGLEPSACAEGRERTAEGRCCWPGQSFSLAHGRCEGRVACPAGTVEHGDDCIAPVLEALPPPPAVGTTLTTDRAGDPYADGTPDTSGWALLADVASPELLRRPTQSVGEDEALIAGSLSLFDVGWLMGWMVPLLDETTNSCRTGDWGSPRTTCGSWGFSFLPVIGGILSGVTSVGAVRNTVVWGSIFGGIGASLQLAGIIAVAVSLTNATTEFRLSPITEGAEEEPGVTLSFTGDVPGADVGSAIEIRF